MGTEEGHDREARAPNAANGEPRVSLCVTTFRRPVLLDHLLASLAALELPDGARLGVEVELVIVDNDRDGSAATVTARWVERGLPIRYAVEPEQNISCARNLAVRLARAGLIAFVDDDERVEPDWLLALLAAAERYDADVVFGAVLPEFERRVPIWLAENPYFTLHRIPTGTIVDMGGAGSCLIRRAALDRLGVSGEPFDVRLGRTGGEDSHLFDRLGRSGARLVFCAEARAFETIPAERLRVVWVVRRAFRTGNLDARRRIELAAGRSRISARTEILARASAVLVCSAIGTVVAPNSTRRFANGLRACSAIGQLLSLGGLRVRGY